MGKAATHTYSPSGFTWYEFQVFNELPEGWAETVIQFALSNYTERYLTPTSVTSYESDHAAQIRVMTVGGKTIRAKQSWLFDLYNDLFLSYAQQCTDEPVSTAKDDRYAINLNVQIGNDMRYEGHVDSNPLEGVLYVTSHPKGSGGELIISNRPNARGPADIEIDAVRIYPQCGMLSFFDARKHPHYVAPLRDKDAVRVVVAMNFYTPACPEEMRPPDLNKHLGLFE